jgi:hypothetical protein
LLEDLKYDGFPANSDDEVSVGYQPGQNGIFSRGFCGYLSHRPRGSLAEDVDAEAVIEGWMWGKRGRKRKGLLDGTKRGRTR